MCARVPEGGIGGGGELVEEEDLEGIVEVKGGRVGPFDF